MPYSRPLDAAYKMGLWSLLIFTFYVLGASAAQAQIGDILCDVYYNVIRNDIGRGLATLAVVALGVGALFGKVSWGMAVMVGVGIGVLYGAEAITNSILDIDAC